MSLGNTPTSPSSGIWDAVKGALGIFKDVNKTSEVTEDTNPTPEDEYESDYSETEVSNLVASWKRSYSTYYADIEPSQEMAFSYWLGKQANDDGMDSSASNPIVDNRIFAAIETFIPIATRANPDPLVQADPSPLGQQLMKSIKSVLVHEADRQKLRKILKRLIRHWIIYRIGCLKISYDLVTDQIVTEAINPKRFIFDKDGHIDESGFFTGEYIGEKKKTSAKKLIEMFSKKEAVIVAKCQGKLGTKLEYFEWWYQGKDVFYTIDETVLGKYKNPHWNYDSKDGTPGINYWKQPKAPYVFLSVFSTGLQPHDETSLVLQNISLQDLINRRYRQIDKNVEGMNNGMVISDRFTDAQASQAASALRRGTAIRAPGEDVTKAVMRFPPGNLPAIVTESLESAQNEVGNIFGTSGSTPEGLDQQDTVRGKILVSQMDSSRIGGGVTEYIEQVADSTYTWWVQFMYVHYTDTHYVVAAGEVDGTALIQIKNTDFALLQTLDITVKEGSLIPKDPLTQRNEAIDLWSADAIDPINFAKKLDMPDPIQYATQLLTWQLVKEGKLPPQAYLPNFGQPQPGQGSLPQQGVGGPAVNPIGPAQGEQASQGLGTTEPAKTEGQQLISSVPIK